MVGEKAAVSGGDLVALWLAGLLLGEGFRRGRVLAMALALAGALVVLRPGLREVKPGHLAQIAATVCFAVSCLFAKRLSGLAPASIVVALLATLGHYTMTRAFQAAPLAVTQPVVFLQILWASLLGAWVFGEAVDGFVILGGAIIVAAISLNGWAEAQWDRVPPQPEA